MTSPADSTSLYAQMAAIVGLGLGVMTSAPGSNNAYASVRPLKPVPQSHGTAESSFLDLSLIAEEGMIGQVSHAGDIDVTANFPSLHADNSSEARRLMDDIQRWTGWSERDFVVELGFVSSTITAWQIGKPGTGFDAAQMQRLARIHDVVEHVHAAAGRDVERTMRALACPPSDGAVPATRYLVSDHPTEAYLTALNAFNLRPAVGLVTGRVAPLRARATVALD